MGWGPPECSVQYSASPGGCTACGCMRLGRGAGAAPGCPIRAARSQSCSCYRSHRASAASYLACSTMQYDPLLLMRPMRTRRAPLPPTTPFCPAAPLPRPLCQVPWRSARPSWRTSRTPSSSPRSCTPWWCTGCGRRTGGCRRSMCEWPKGAARAVPRMQAQG